MITKYLYATASGVILGLCGWIWFQSQKIDSLRVENQVQAQTIENQQKANQHLSERLEAERQAVETAQKLSLIHI